MSSNEMAGDKPFDLYLSLITPEGNISQWFAIPVAARSRFELADVANATANTSSNTTPAKVESPKPVAATQPQQTTRPETTSPKPSVNLNEVKVARGMTLAKIVDDNGIDGFTRNQQLIAWQRANPHAFINKNINLIKAGATLNAPTQEQLNNITVAEANREVRAQVQQFNAASGVRTGATTVPSTQQQTAVTSTATPPPATGEDRLSLSAATTNTAEASSDELISKQKALDELTARNAELEANLEDAKNRLGLEINSNTEHQQKIAELENQLNEASGSAASDLFTWLMTGGAFVLGSGLIGLLWFFMGRKKKPAKVVPSASAVSNEPEPQPLPLNVDFDLELPPAKAEPEPVVNHVEETPEPSIPEESIPVLQEPVVNDFSQKTEPSDPEIDSQLVLAQGYIEINDKDSARELLNDIVTKGNQDQISRAQALLASL